MPERLDRRRSSSGGSPAASTAAALTPLTARTAPTARLDEPTLRGATWILSTRGEGTDDERREWLLELDLDQLSNDELVQLCNGALLPEQFVRYLIGAAQPHIAVMFLESTFLLEQHSGPFESAAIGCPHGEDWVAWILFAGSYQLLEQAQAAGVQQPEAMRGVFFIPGCGLGKMNEKLHLDFVGELSRVQWLTKPKPYMVTAALSRFTPKEREYTALVPLGGGRHALCTADPSTLGAHVRRCASDSLPPPQRVPW